jgi:hypothetical protein
VQALHYKRKPLRLLVGVGVPVLLLAGVAFCRIFQTTPPCLFYELTGLYCPGCGSGRALLALLQGRFYAAFRYHPLLILASPALAYALMKYYLAFVLGRDLLPLPKIRGRWFGIAVVAVVMGYWILRNLPFPPFCWLAPCAIPT